MRSDCCAGEGDSGYVAAMLWRSVQVPRPRASTSGGQSSVAVVVVVAVEGVVEVAGLVTPLTKLEKADLEEQARHLGRGEPYQYNNIHISPRQISNIRLAVLVQDHPRGQLRRLRITTASPILLLLHLTDGGHPGVVSSGRAQKSASQEPGAKNENRRKLAS